MTPDQQAVIADFNRAFGWTFDQCIRKDSSTLDTMMKYAAMLGWPDLASRIGVLRAEARS